MAVTSTQPLSSDLSIGKTNKMEETNGFSAPDRSSMDTQTPLTSRTAAKIKEKVQPKVGLEKPDPLRWELRDILHFGPVVGVHLMCLLAPFTFTWSAFGVACFLHILVGPLGITLSLHRNLTHKSFKLPKFLEYTFAYFGMLAFQGDPIFWVSSHRYHHKYTDTPRDPHSPLEGFWFSHIMWTFSLNKAIIKGVMSDKIVSDMTSQRYYRFLEKTLVFHIYLHLIILYMLGGIPFVVWGVGVRTVYLYHVTFLVNSACHTWGSQPWNTGDLSRNNWIVAILSFGEGWHNNHHAFADSARHGLEWWQLDVTWYIIKSLEYVGLATDVKLPTEQQKKKKAFRNEVEGKKVI